MSSKMSEDRENQQQQQPTERLGERWMILGHITDAFKRFSRVLRRVRNKSSCADHAMRVQQDWSNTEFDDEWFDDVANKGIHEDQCAWRQQPQQQQAINPSAEQQQSRYKGVRRYKMTQSWVTEIRPTKESAKIWLGSYQTPRAAARAFDVGTFYCNKKRKHSYNFPDSIDHLPPRDEIDRLPPLQRKTRIQNLAKEVAERRL